LLHPSRLTDKTIVDLITNMAETNGAAAFQRQQTAMLGRPDSRPDLTRIHCPTLVLCGRDDVLTPVAVAEEMADMIPNAHLHIIEHCGHFAPLEQPEQVTAAMRNWLLALEN
jgi:pimeloyl-ACP methyl ester carboxylesterase